MSQREDINTISPTTGEVVTHNIGDSVEQLLEKADISTAAFGSFQRTTLSDRKDYVTKALSWLSEHQDELADSLTKEMGRPRAYTAGEITTAVKRANYLLKVSDAALAATEGEPEEGFKRFIEKVPVGPVLVIFPWNVSLGAKIYLE
jgi:acyl-CoA reductase-like NAD-dependent aldehyde dehydrogenase